MFVWVGCKVAYFFLSKQHPTHSWVRILPLNSGNKNRKKREMETNQAGAWPYWLFRDEIIDWYSGLLKRKIEPQRIGGFLSRQTESPQIKQQASLLWYLIFSSNFKSISRLLELEIQNTLSCWGELHHQAKNGHNNK